MADEAYVAGECGAQFLAFTDIDRATGSIESTIKIIKMALIQRCLQVREPLERSELSSTVWYTIPVPVEHDSMNISILCCFPMVLL